MKSLQWILSILLLVLVQWSCCAKILGVFPSFSRSHYAVGVALFKELARRGHELTVISYNEEKNVPPDYKFRQIKLPEKVTKTPPAAFFEGRSPYKSVLIMNEVGNDMVEKMLITPAVRDLLNSGEKFDAVIMDQFLDDGLAYLAHHFGAVQILFYTGFTNNWVNPLVGNPAPPSAVAELLLDLPNKMNFWQRLKNVAFYIYSELNRHLLFFPSQDRLIKKYFPGAPPLYDYLYNVSLVLLNSHESINDAVPLVPNMKPVGGIHLEPVKPLPEDLRQFLDSAQDGVILFSMGSILKSKFLPLEKRQAILNVFPRLKVKVLWKWEGDDLTNKPPNVFLAKWFPQRDVLAHPNVKGFITHGGLLSIIEAISSGVPLLVVPVFGDQMANGAIAAEKGYAINLPFNQLDERTFETAIKNLLHNPIYRNTALHSSELFNDRPIKPLDEAAYWVEYVIKYRGAKHLKVVGMNLKWYQYLLLDIIFFVLISICVLIYITKKAVSFVARRNGSKKVKKN